MEPIPLRTARPEETGPVPVAVPVDSLRAGAGTLRRVVTDLVCLAIFAGVATFGASFIARSMERALEAVAAAYVSGQAALSPGARY